ncbi:MAG: rhomboid family intramembrane serine protease [Deltaproteobacteria bacterium]|nr:rhomboid family intramembrane serine protease [Deltaproteobacteria bacterium]
MFERQKSGSVVCPSCGKLVGVNEKSCFSCGRSRPGMFGMTKAFRDLGLDLNFVDVILWGCGLMFVITLAVDPSNLFSGGFFGFLSPSRESIRLFGATGAFPVLAEKHWWTLLSAGWLHGSLLHVGFNIYALRSLGPMTAELYGGSRLVILFTVATVSGFALSTAAGLLLTISSQSGGSCLLSPISVVMGRGGAGFTLGASAGLCGLIGAIYYYGSRGGSSAMTQQAKSWIISLAIIGILASGYIDNWAHLGGGLGGYLAARVLDPLKPERTDHLIGALVCLLLSALSIAVSILAGLSTWQS